MQSIFAERELAIAKFYKEVKVAKSTLSSWLKDFPLTHDEKSYLKTRIDSNISRGRIKAATALRHRKKAREDIYRKEADQEFRDRCNDPFFIAGVALYWAEGSKRSSGFSFTNSDVDMVSLFVIWIETYFAIPRDKLQYRLYTHKHFKDEGHEIWWATRLGIGADQFKKTVYKPSQKMVKKRPGYTGCLRVTTPSGAKLLYKMKIWQNRLAQIRRS